MIAAAASTGVAALIPHSLRAEEAAQPASAPAPNEVGELHFAALNETRKTLDETKIISKKGLKLLVAVLAKRRVITRAQAEVLNQLIDIIFDTETFDAMEKALADLLRKLNEAGSEVVVAIIQIAKSSIAYVREFMGNEKTQRAIVIIASDLEGALAGAATGERFGPKGALIGLLAGAVSSSSLELFSEEGR